MSIKKYTASRNAANGVMGRTQRACGMLPSGSYPCSDDAGGRTRAYRASAAEGELAAEMRGSRCEVSPETTRRPPRLFVRSEDQYQPRRLMSISVGPEAHLGFRVQLQKVTEPTNYGDYPRSQHKI